LSCLQTRTSALKLLLKLLTHISILCSWVPGLPFPPPQSIS